MSGPGEKGRVQCRGESDRKTDYTAPRLARSLVFLGTITRTVSGLIGRGGLSVAGTVYPRLDSKGSGTLRRMRAKNLSLGSCGGSISSIQRARSRSDVLE